VEEKGASSIIVVIAVLVVVVVAASYSYYLFTRVTLTRTTDIGNNPSKYMGKQVELEGKVTNNPPIGGGEMLLTGVLTDSSGNILLVHMPDHFYPTGATYLVKGTVENFNPYLAVDVTSIGLA
jgi:hypothetical protein